MNKFETTVLSVLVSLGINTSVINASDNVNEKVCKTFTQKWKNIDLSDNNPLVSKDWKTITISWFNPEYSKFELENCEIWNLVPLK